MKKLLLINGPNLDMLGVREPGVYGSQTLADLEKLVKDYGAQCGVEIDAIQSNSEGDLVEAIHDARLRYDGIIYNPGAHTHYSYALRDALGGIDAKCTFLMWRAARRFGIFRSLRLFVLRRSKGAAFKGIAMLLTCSARVHTSVLAKTTRTLLAQTAS